ncbi:F-box protein SKIP8 [Ananas comosus]|uniref:F-box protein SKIP8 n=1 Tax=Ananas comosus TaxID=4615 RepID=A0A199UX92_ANACO|nr:F-box protein SKIP8 [Ananas comosus]
MATASDVWFTPAAALGGARRAAAASSSAPRRLQLGRRRQGGRGGGGAAAAQPLAGLQTRSFRLLRPALVKSGEAEGNPSTEGTILDEQTLKRDLEIAVEEEDYVRAAKLRDELRLLHEDSKASVLAANSRFYHAFKNGDLSAMHSVWAKGDHVCVVHPGAGRISGYELVMESWELVCGSDYEFPLQIDLKNVEVHVRGDTGYVTCMEVVKTKGSSWGKQVATNVFERVDGQWFICIHHASHMDE